MTKIFITGSNGQLGRELTKQLNRFDKYKIKVIKTDLEDLDIANMEAVINTIEDIKPNIVINCAAYTNVDKCEMDEINAFKVNSIGTRNLAIATNKIGAKIVHISTDYVFDGQANKPYREFDITNPQSIYGKSKLLGEKFIEKFNPRHFIIRTAWLYGDGNNFVRTMLKLASEKKELNVVDDQIGSPTSTVDLSKVIIELMQTEYYGLYHGTCEGSCSWYRFAKRIFELKSIDVNINKITTEQLNRLAPRPKYSVLDNFMLKIIGLNTFRHWEEALEEYLKKYELKEIAIN